MNWEDDLLVNESGRILASVGTTFAAGVNVYAAWDQGLEMPTLIGKYTNKPAAKRGAEQWVGLRALKLKMGGISRLEAKALAVCEEILRDR